MGEEEPEAKDGLGKDVKDSIRNNFGIDIDIARAISDTPNTAHC